MAITFRDFIQSNESAKPHYFVIGHPISHSLSPVMHQCALDHYQIPAIYRAVDLPSDQIDQFVSWCNSDSFLGCNITIPYKEALMYAADELDADAKELGVMNTLSKEGSILKGYNTDLYGFLKPLEPFIDQLKGESAIIFGTGGSSRAVRAGLIRCGINEITFVSRNPQLSTETELDPEIFIRTVDYSQWQVFAEDATIIVNTTPLGMYPNVDQTPVRENDAFLLTGKICYDLVYNPIETHFMKLTAKEGGIAINGLDMLIWQGSRSFEIWNGVAFPIDQVKIKLKTFFNTL
ncbi:MAG: shikimate dehydrogenase [Balneolaceae bacterium]